MEKKVAVYICTGCGIGEALDIEQLGKVASEEGKASLCRSHHNLCGRDGVELIRRDISDEGANILIITACSPRVMGDVFRFEGCVVEGCRSFGTTLPREGRLFLSIMSRHWTLGFD